MFFKTIKKALKYKKKIFISFYMYLYKIQAHTIIKLFILLVLFVVIILIT